jgi:hypothetical protein
MGKADMVKARVVAQDVSAITERPSIALEGLLLAGMSFLEAIPARSSIVANLTAIDQRRGKLDRAAANPLETAHSSIRWAILWPPFAAHSSALIRRDRSTPQSLGWNVS